MITLMRKRQMGRSDGAERARASWKNSRVTAGCRASFRPAPKIANGYPNGSFPPRPGPFAMPSLDTRFSFQISLLLLLDILLLSSWREMVVYQSDFVLS